MNPDQNPALHFSGIVLVVERIVKKNPERPPTKRTHFW